MRFMCGVADGRSAVFFVDGDDAYALTDSDPPFSGDLLSVIGREAEAKAAAGQVAPVPLSSITPALPIRYPGKVMCLGLNYIDHIKEGGYEVPTYPALFMRSATSLIPAGAPMVRPSCSEQLDYEAEMMLIVGRGGRHIAEADALSHIFGYTIFNDGSVRDYQRKTHQWTPGKNFDATGPVGPVVVTPDELPTGAAGLKIESRVGDEVLQSASTDEMLWSVPRMIAAISEFTTLQPGDLIATGTPPGVGHAKTPPRWLRPGETVEVEIEGIGVLSNPVVAEEDQEATAAA